MTIELKKQEKNKIYLRRYKTKYPWAHHYSNAKDRCRPNEKYGKRGILFLMTCDDFKKLWFRDKAYLLKQPSIDRVDNDGNYAYENCRFIEMKENQRLGGIISGKIRACGKE
jgi:hypothetical protein